MKLIFIRHAEPDYSIDSLTEKGWKEARILSERVSTWPDITQIYCSPLGRAKDTASFSLKALNRDAIIYDWLQEFSFGVKDLQKEGKRLPWDFMPDYWTKYPVSYDKDNWLQSPLLQEGGLENRFKDVTEGIDKILKSFGYSHQNGFFTVAPEFQNKNHKEDTLVFFCHLGVSFVIIGYLLGISPFLLWQSAYVAPTSVTILGTEERQDGIASFRLQTLGDTKHLAKAGEPISSSGYFTDCFQY